MGHGEHVPHDVGSDAPREHLTRPRRLVLVMHAPAFVKLPLFHLFSPAETLAVAQRLQPVS